jgi:hypothetical protein
MDIRTWNVAFDKRLENGAEGKQAHFGLFYFDDRGRLRRMTEAEGHEVAHNPETEERNPIGQESPSTAVRGYNDSFGKDVPITKGSPSWGYYSNFANLRPTGNNALIKIVHAHFMVEEEGDPHYNYLAYSYMAICTVDTSNYTEGTLAVNFTQDGDRVMGIIKRVDNQPDDGDPDLFEYEFVPSSKINVTRLDVSDEGIELGVGEEKWVETSFSPLGCPSDFNQASGNSAVCVVERRRQSVIIRGRGAGTTTVTVTSAKDPAKKAEIAVTVS